MGKGGGGSAAVHAKHTDWFLTHTMNLGDFTRLPVYLSDK